MRTIVLLTALIGAGCTSGPTLQELEDEALRTGDWEAVEKREALLEHRKGPDTPDCPTGQTKICVGKGRDATCECTARATSRVSPYH